MKRLAPALVAVAIALTAAPQGARAENPRLPELPELPELDTLERETREAVAELLALIGPLVERFSAFVDELPAYEAPVMLPNGDILIRRKMAPPPAPGEAETEI